MTAMDTTISRADLERAARTKMRLRAGETVDRGELEHAARVKLSLGGAARPDSGLTGGASPSVMGDLLGFHPGAPAAWSPSSEPVPGTVYSDGVATLKAEPRGQVPVPGGYGAVDRPGASGVDLDVLKGLARSPGILAEQAAGLLAGAQADVRMPWDRQAVPPEQTIPGAIRGSLDRYMPPPETFAGRAAEQAIPLAAGIGGATVAGPALAGAAQSYGGTMAAAMQRGSTPGQAQAEALVSGLTGGTVGALPLGRFAQRVAGGRPAGGLIGDIALQTAAGTAQAGVDAAAASWIEKNPALWEQFRGSMGETAAMNAVLGLVGHGFSAAAGSDNTGPRPGGAAESAGSTLPPGDAIPQAAPRPDQARARAAEAVPAPTNEPTPPARQPAAAADTNPAAMELPREVPQEGRPQGREGLLTQPAPTPPGESAPGDGGASTPNAVGGPIRSTDTLAPGETVTDAKGQRFTVGPTLESGKVVVRREDGRAVRLTAGEMEARGWSKVHEGVPQVHEGVQGEPPARIDAGEPSSLPDGVPAVGGQEKSTPESGRVGPPPETVANPPEMPKGNRPESPDSSPPPEPNQPGFWKSLRDRAQQRINERAAAQREAEAQYRGTGARRGSAGSLDPRTLADRAVILASHIAEAGVSGAKAIKAKARELFGSDDPAVVRAAYRILREGQGPDGQVDAARLELAAHDALTEAQAKARTAQNESADIREMMAKREGDERVRSEKAAKWEAIKKARAEERAKAKDAAAVAKAKSDLADEQAQPGKLADQLRRDEKVSGKAFKAAERAAQSSFGGQIRAERADAERRVQNAADAAAGFERDAGQQSTSIREMMAKREGDRRVAEAKAEAKQKAKDTAETAQYLKQEAVAAERAKGQLKAEAAEATRKEQAARDKTRMDVAVGLEREAGQQSADIREGMAKRAGEIALSKAAQEARAKREEQRKAFYAQIQTEQGRRSDLATLARDMLGDADARKVIKGIAEARSERDQVKIIQRVLDLREARADTESRAYLRGVTGRETVKKPPTLASMISKLMGIKPGDQKTARKGRLSKTDVAELRTPERTVVQPVWEALRKDMAPDTAPLADHIEKVAEDSGRTVFSPDQIRDLRNAAGKTIDRMTPEQRRAVADALNHAAWLSDNANAIEVAGKRMDLVEARKTVGSEVQAFSGTKETTDPKNPLLNAAKKAVTVDQLDTSRLVSSLAGRNSEAHRILYEAPVEGESRAWLLHGQAADALQAVADKHGMTRAKLADLGKPKPFQLASGREVKMSGSDRMMAAGLWSDPQNRAEILKTGLQFANEKGTVDRIVRVTEADMKGIDASLTPFEREWVETFKKQGNALYGKANDAHERMTGFRLEERADHFSRSRDLTATEREVDPQTQQAQQAGWVEDAGIFQKRSGASAPVMLPDNIFAWGDRHLRTLAYMAHVAEPILGARRLMADPALRTVMRRAGGEKWVEAMNDRLRAISNANPATPTTGLEAATAQATNFVARNRLAFRITSAIKQRLGFINAWMESEGGATGAKLLLQALDPTNVYSPTLAKELTDNSGYFHNRMNSGGVSLATAADASRPTSSTTLGRAYDNTMRAGMLPIEVADNAVNVGIYKTYKAKFYADGLRGQELIDKAVRATEIVVRRSQNPISPADKSGMNLSKNPLLKFATLFSSPANKMRNQFIEAAREFQANPTGDTARRYVRAHVGMIAAAGLSSLMTYYLGKGVQKAAALVTGNVDDERDPKEMKDVALGAAADLAGVLNLWPGSDSVVRQSLGAKTNNSGVLDNLVQGLRAVHKAETAETVRGVDKAAAWIKLARSLPLMPDALLDYSGQAIKGASGPEPAGWSIAAALKRNDYKAALERAKKLAALKLQRTKEDGEPVEPETVQRGIAASIAAYLNKGLKKGQDDDAMEENAATARDLAADAMP